MVSPVTIMMAYATATVASAAVLKNRCRLPYDQCGWVLANSNFAYTYDELQAACGSDEGSHIYDALYRCDPETGALKYIRWCGGPGKCETGIVANDNCRN